MDLLTRSVQVILIITCFLLIACEDNDSVDLQIENVSLDANLLPPVAPGTSPVWCRIDVVITNNSIKRFTGLKIPFAELIVSTTGELIGTLDLHTDWHGELPPGGRERFSLFKVDSLSELKRIPCREKIDIRLSLFHSDRMLESSVTKDFLFVCYY